MHSFFLDETKTTKNRRLKSIKSFPPKSTLRFPVWTWNESTDQWELRHYRYKLVFVETQSCRRQYETTDNYCPIKKSVKKHVWYTNKLILAMPRRSIELISWVRWQEIRESLIKSVVIQPSNKLLLAYSQPWWRNQGIMAGRSITDLPLRMTVATALFIFLFSKILTWIFFVQVLFRDRGGTGGR